MSDSESSRNAESVNEDLQFYDEDLEIIQESRENIEEEAEEIEHTEENTEGDENAQSKKTEKPKKVVRNPQPKLNADTLRGPKGLIALEEIFNNVKFKPPGNEEENLNILMKTYEYWCNRLFPKYPFDDCIAKIEKLGTKKLVQTYVKKMRLGMLCEDPAVRNDVEEITENNDTQADDWDDVFDGLVDRAPILHPQNQHTQLSELSLQVDLSEEQKERIRLNQEKAKKIREEKLRNAKSKCLEIMASQEITTEDSCSRSSTRNEWENNSDPKDSNRNSLGVDAEEEHGKLQEDENSLPNEHFQNSSNQGNHRGSNSTTLNNSLIINIDEQMDMDCNEEINTEGNEKEFETNQTEEDENLEVSLSVEENLLKTKETSLNKITEKLDDKIESNKTSNQKEKECQYEDKENEAPETNVCTFYGKKTEIMEENFEDIATEFFNDDMETNSILVEADIEAT